MPKSRFWLRRGPAPGVWQGLTSAVDDPLLVRPRQPLGDLGGRTSGDRPPRRQARQHPAVSGRRPIRATSVKILDFGIAKLLGAEQLTQEGRTLGTVFYMSPSTCSGDM